MFGAHDIDSLCHGRKSRKVNCFLPSCRRPVPPGCESEGSLIGSQGSVLTSNFGMGESWKGAGSLSRRGLDTADRTLVRGEVMVALVCSFRVLASRRSGNAYRATILVEQGARTRSTTPAPRRPRSGHPPSRATTLSITRLRYGLPRPWRGSSRTDETLPPYRCRCREGLL